ncbi:hypothetical protein C8Q80DRAFT_579721 [Daedaleopsis nitida]|nr:hypothetical protein C8Q80DRAFT_579721 [Daedaleopsis nitida]
MPANVSLTMMSVRQCYHNLSPLYHEPPPLSAEHVALRDQLAEYNAAVLELSSRLNALSLPCRLPPEVLSRIFVMSAAAVHEEDTAWSAVHGPRGGNHGYYRWISVALVCRYWRNVALGCASFWAFIAFEYHMPRDIYPELLRRSLNCPLTIVYHSRESCNCQPCKSLWYVDSIGQEIISEELPRIRHLIIIIESTAFSTYDLWQELAASAPSLETLEVGHTRLTNNLAMDLPNLLFQSDLPRLRSLALRNFKYKWTNSLFQSSLRTLEIIERPAPLAIHVDMHRFISMLSTMSQLEHLVVEGLPPIHPVNAIASLPQLRYIRLKGDFEELAFVLFRLRFPSTTAIHLIISYEPGPPVARFVQALSRTLSASHLHTASYVVPNNFLVRINDRSSSFRAWSNILTATDRTVNRLWSRVSDIQPRILLTADKTVLPSIVAGLYLPHLTALQISIGCAMPPDWIWSKWFAGAPNVSFLRLSGHAGYRVGRMLSLRVRMQEDDGSGETDSGDEGPGADSEIDDNLDAGDDTDGSDTGLSGESDEDSLSNTQSGSVDGEGGSQASSVDDHPPDEAPPASDGKGCDGDTLSIQTGSDDQSWVITAVMPSLRTIHFIDVTFPYTSSFSDPSDSDDMVIIKRTREFDADGMVKGLQVRKNLGAEDIESLEFVRCRGLQVSRLQTLVGIVDSVVVDRVRLTKLD